MHFVKSSTIIMLPVTDLDISIQVRSGDDEDGLPAKIQPPVETRRGPGGILRHKNSIINN